MKVLVTGGAGFIGSHVVDGYIRAGHQTMVIDDLSNGKAEHVNSRAILMKGSITDSIFLDTVFKEHGPFDLVNHHAAQKNVIASVDDPVFDAKVNIMGTLTLLETMRRHTTHRIVFISTGGLYSEECELPIVESASIEPVSPYAIAKYAIENYLRFYRKLGFVTQILRYANVYGPRQDPEGEAGVIAMFCSRVFAKEPLIIYGDGLQTRDFIYVDDVVAANMLVTDHKKSGEWNIGTGIETQIVEVAHALLDIAQEQGLGATTTEYLPERPNELRRNALSSEQAHSDLRWVARESLATGLRHTFSSFI